MVASGHEDSGHGDMAKRDVPGPPVTAEGVPILATVEEQPAARGRRLAWSTAIFALATGLSRILGLVREVVAAYYFGAQGKINAFTVAFQVPNLIRALVATPPSRPPSSPSSASCSRRASENAPGVSPRAS